MDHILRNPGHPEHRNMVLALRDSRNRPLRDSVSFKMEPYVANRVHGNLWMGGWPPPGMAVGSSFDCLVLAACEFQVPDVFPGVQVVTACLDDSGAPFTMEEKKQAVAAAGKVISWMKDGLRVLTTCYAGRNRSGLITAIALCKGAGLSPEEAIRMIRRARDNSMMNGQFESFIHQFCGRH